jgi:zinc/manganese transport system substrate-binding protein
MWRPMMRRSARPTVCFAACWVLCLLVPRWAVAQSHPLLIVAAENFYGDVARQLAGPDVRVVSILQNPDADPHLFEPDAATARLVADADILIYNGAHYDAWLERLLANAGRHARRVVSVAALMGRTGTNVNPHLWYDPQTMPRLALALTMQLDVLDPAARARHATRLQAFLESLQPIDVQVAQMRRLYAGAPITATEPVVDGLTGAIGLDMRNGAFQLSIMNDTEPGPRETAQFEQSLRSHAVRVLIYNRQTSGEVVQRMRQIAGQSSIPVVAVSETEPAGLNYQAWMLQTLTSLNQALAEQHR